MGRALERIGLQAAPVGRPSKERLPKYVQKVTARGNVYWYLRVPGRERVKLCISAGCSPRSSTFLAAYEAALNGQPAILPSAVIGASRSPSGTVSALIASFLADPAIKRGKRGDLSERTAKEHRRYLEKFRNEFGTLPVAKVKPQDLQCICDKLSPNVQKKWKDAVGRLFSFGTKRGHVSVNPTVGLERDAVPLTDGHPTWGIEHCAAFEQVWSEDSPERLAYGLARYVGARRGDIITMTWPDIKTRLDRDTGQLVEVVEFTPRKTAKTGLKVVVPLHPELQKLLRWHRRDVGPILSRCGRDGLPTARPHSEDSFARWFCQAAKVAGLEGYSVHGLRKTATCTLLELRVDPAAIQALLGWSSLEMVQRYGRKFDRELSAMAGMKVWASSGR